MKRFLFGIMLIALLALVSACATTAPRHMMLNEKSPLNLGSIKPETSKSALVVARTTNFGGAIEFDTYLEKKMIGVTQWKSYFIRTDVNPGVSYVISKAENMEPVKINFEPGRIYFIQQIPRMGVWKARISIALMTPEDLQSMMGDDCKLLTYDPKNPGEDLSDKDYKNAVKDYEREIKEGLHKEYEGYRGVPAK